MVAGGAGMHATLDQAFIQRRQAVIAQMQQFEEMQRQRQAAGQQQESAPQSGDGLPTQL